MALPSAKVSVSRDPSSSRSPLSPTVIHYRQKYQVEKDHHREIKRYHHYFQKEQIRNTSRRQHQNRRINKISTRHQSPSIWEIHQSSNGRIYYYNVITDQSQWEKPPREQMPSSITKKSIHSKRTSNNDNELSPNNHHRKQRKDNIKIKSSLKKFQKGKRKIDEVELSTPVSPPANEKIQIDLVDPVPTPSNSITDNFIAFIDPQQQSHCQISSIPFNEDKFKSLHSKRSIKAQIIEDLSSTIIQSSLCPSESTINAILDLQCSSPILSTNTNLNSDYITRYYRAELIEHLLNWPSTQIEREATRLSNEQIRFRTSQLASLRTDLFSIRLKFERNRLQLLKYRYTLVNQQDLLNKLQLIDLNQI